MLAGPTTLILLSPHPPMADFLCEFKLRLPGSHGKLFTWQAVSLALNFQRHVNWRWDLDVGWEW